MNIYEFEILFMSKMRKIYIGREEIVAESLQNALNSVLAAYESNDDFVEVLSVKLICSGEV